MKILGVIPIIIGFVIVLAMLKILPKNLAFVNHESKGGTVGRQLLMYWRIFIMQFFGLGVGFGLMYLGYKIIT